MFMICLSNILQTVNRFNKTKLVHTKKGKKKKRKKRYTVRKYDKRSLFR